MSLELRERITTSISLFIIAIFCISINQIIFKIGAVAITMACFGEWIGMNFEYFSKKKIKFTLIMLSGFIYLFIFFFVSLLALRGDSFKSTIFLIIILCICISSDTGGYIFGKIIGGKKLIKISPNKTIAGAIGSLIFSLLPLLLIYFLNFPAISFEFSLKNILFCLIVSLACQLGDLFISYFKRLNNVKDTGNLLPGHGGLLDRVDGIIFAIPVAYILISSNIF